MHLTKNDILKKRLLILLVSIFLFNLLLQSAIADTRKVSFRMQAIINLHTKKIKQFANTQLLISEVKKHNSKSIPLGVIIQLDKRWVEGKAEKCRF